MFPLLGAALITGLTGGVHCVGMCGGFAGAAAARGGAWPWHLGRITTYAVLGALAGSLGFVLPGPSWLPAALAAFLILFFAARMAGIGGAQGLHLPVPKALVKVGARFARKQGVGGRTLFGMATGLLPCGLVYTGIALAVAADGPLAGALTMVVFGLGTIPLLAGLGAVVKRIANRSIHARRGLALAVAIMGLWSISLRATPVAQAAAPADEAAVDSADEHPPGCPMHAD